MMKSLGATALVLLPALFLSCGKKASHSGGQVRTFPFALTEQCDGSNVIASAIQGYNLSTATAFANSMNAQPKARWTETTAIETENKVFEIRQMNEKNEKIASRGGRKGYTVTASYNPDKPTSPQVNVSCAYSELEKSADGAVALERDRETLGIILGLGDTMRLSDETVTNGVKITLTAPPTLAMGNEASVGVVSGAATPMTGEDSLEMIRLVKNPALFTAEMEKSIKTLKDEGCTGGIQFFSSPNGALAYLVEATCPIREREGTYYGMHMKHFQEYEAH